MKKYIAKTNVCINVVLPGGVNRHVSFSPLTSGGSVFYTDDPAIQDALESHYKYGKLFRADSVIDAKENVADEEYTQHDAEQSEAAGNTVIEVADPDEAKDYLCEHFGFSRTKIKTIKAILAAAESSNVTFKGLTQ